MSHQQQQQRPGFEAGYSQFHPQGPQARVQTPAFRADFGVQVGGAGATFGGRSGIIRRAVAQVGSWLQRWAERGTEQMLHAGERLQEFADRGGRGAEQFGESMQRWGGQSPLAPRRFKRSDERIAEDVYHRLSLGYLDASDIDIEVEDGIVSLRGSVDRRSSRRLAEDLVEDLPGVLDIVNELRISELGEGEKRRGDGGRIEVGAQRESERPMM